MKAFAELSAREKRLAAWLPRCALALLILALLVYLAWGSVLGYCIIILFVAGVLGYYKLLKIKRRMEIETRCARSLEWKKDPGQNGLMKRRGDDVIVSAGDWEKLGNLRQDWLEGELPQFQEGDVVLRWERYGTAGGSDGLAIERNGKIVAKCLLRRLSFAERKK